MSDKEKEIQESMSIIRGFIIYINDLSIAPDPEYTKVIEDLSYALYLLEGESDLCHSISI